MAEDTKRTATVYQVCYFIHTNVLSLVEAPEDGCGRKYLSSDGRSHRSQITCARALFWYYVILYF